MAIQKLVTISRGSAETSQHDLSINTYEPG
jgi:hypothetical protein